MVATLAGVFGGLLRSMQEDGKLVVPKFNSEDNSISPGLLVDCLSGLAGSYVAFFLLSSNFLTTGTPINTIEGMKFIATGIIGGYAGRSLLAQVSDQLIKDMSKRVDEASKKLEENDEINTLKLLVDNQIVQGLSEPDRSKLNKAINSAPAEMQDWVYYRSKERRSVGARTNKAIVGRTIPIFQALIALNPSDHRYHAELAYALKDQEEVSDRNFEDAIAELSKAIQLREVSGTLADYEFNRAICRIAIDPEYKIRRASSESNRELILNDLVVASQHLNLAQLMKEGEEDKKIYNPIPQWLDLNETGGLPEELNQQLAKFSELISVKD
jgi:tetratricopeptide (TPR) repeat protein